MIFITHLETVIAGSDTSSTTMAMLTYFLARNRRVYCKWGKKLTRYREGDTSL